MRSTAPASYAIFLILTITTALLLPSSLALVPRSSTPSLDPPGPPKSNNSNTDIAIPPQPPLPPKPPFPPPSPHPPPLPTGKIECFKPDQHLAFPLNLADCDNTIELILHDKAGPFTYQNWTRDGRGGSHKIPEAWHVGRCQVLLTTAYDVGDMRDELRLVDIIVAVRKVLEICVPASKTGLGGLAQVGHGKGFFVALNGHEAPGAMDGGSAVGAVNGISTAALDALAQSEGVTEGGDVGSS
ncbi:hypothetical protein OEA41_005191 [Lepraria neglecta]|uniref:Uncharacterized protein n=1 Tax=Lepraria neglecta TaxID=209136 RepID=A0AAD9Z3A3_9LECA|nr:hypothetical protein OEA41_005191 [Lepraria neglecta]